MRVRKPQSKGTGGNLAKTLKAKEKKSKKSDLTTSTAKQSLLHECSSNPLKAVPTKKSVKATTPNKKASTEKIDKSTKKPTKQKVKPVDKNEKKSELLNKSAEQETATSMGLNASKEKSSTATKKTKIEKKTTTASATTNEKKSIKDDNKVVPKSNKELKNLDIQLTGYSSVKAASTASDSDTDKVINASICEIVKTKARAASSTFNVSGNRSPLLVASSPSPSAMKSVHKTNSEKIPIDSDAKTVKDEENVKKVAATIEKVIPLKEKKSQTSNKDEKKPVAKKPVKVDGKEKKSIDNKIAPKIQKKKIKQASQTNEPKENKELTVSTEKSTEIKTPVDNSKSLIDSITEVINEVVKQYNDSSFGAEKSREQQLKTEKSAKSTNSQVNFNKKKKTIKSTGNKVTKATAGKKLLNQKKLNVIHEASDLVTDGKNSMKNLAKKNKIQKLKNDEEAQNVENDSMDIEAGAKDQQKIEKSKKIKMESKKSAMAKQKSKVNTKALTESKTSKNDSVPELKGSKIIKIATKAKKKVKIVAGTVKRPVMKLLKKALVPAKEMENVKKTETVEQTTTADALVERTEDLSEDDDLSLNELKAQLTTANDTKNSSVSSASKENSKRSKASIKSTLIGSGSKQKNISRTLQKPPMEKNAEEKMVKPQRKNIKPDVYDFHESGHSSEDALYIHKKNRAELNEQAKKSEKVSKAKGDSVQKTEEVVRKMPIKKRIDASAKEVKVAAKAKPKAKERSKDVISDAQDNVVKNKSKAKKKDESESPAGSDNEKYEKPKKVLAKTRAATNKQKLTAKNRRMKLFGFYSGPKRHRMASLNALAKVQCLYENESRTAQELGFVKEPQNVHRMKIVSEAERNIDHNTVKEDPKHKDPEEEKEVKIESKPEKDDSTVSDRTLRKVPGIRGEGSMWEMDSSLDESDRDDDKLVSFFPHSCSKCESQN